MVNMKSSAGKLLPYIKVKDTIMMDFAFAKLHLWIQ